MSAVELPSQLAPHPRRPRLSGLLDTLEVRTQQAIAEQWSYQEFLARLIQDEAERREHKRLEPRLRRGQVNTTKSPRRNKVALSSARHVHPGAPPTR